MPDTIKIAQIISQKEFDRIYDSVLWKKKYDPDTGDFIGLSFKELGKEKPYLFAFTAQDGISYLSARVSLPTLYRGSNARLLSQKQIWKALEKLSEYVSTKSFLDFDAMTANVWEIHFTQDIRFQETSIKHLLDQISKMTIPYFKPARYADSTVYFHSGKVRTICIYDKQKDCIDKHFSNEDIEYSKGNLRIEYRFLTADSIKDLVKRENLENREAQTILQAELSNRILNPIKEQILTLLKFSDAQDKILQLQEVFGRRSSTMISHITKFDNFGANYYKNPALGTIKSAYYRNQRDCRRVGIYSLIDIPTSQNETNEDKPTQGSLLI